MIDTADRWWLTLAYPSTRCDGCGERAIEGQVVAFRASDRSKLCCECALMEGVTARPSRKLLAYVEEHPDFERNLEILSVAFSDLDAPDFQPPVAEPTPAVRGPRNPLLGGERARRAYAAEVAAR